MNKPQDNIANIVDFKGLKISLSSPDEIMSWSHGEVVKPETINYRTLRPESDGLFSEAIFGPTKDWECYCGKYKRIRYRGVVCDKCHVEVTQSRVRRERMGHIKLAVPVVHVWYFKGTPSKLSLILDIGPRALENVVYFASYLVMDVDSSQRDDVIKSLGKTMADRLKEMEATHDKNVVEAEEEGKEKVEKIKEKLKGRDELGLALSEIEVSTKQRVLKLKEDFAAEKGRLDDIYKALIDLVKSVKPLSQITEEEYLKLVEYDAADFIKVGMGAEALLECTKKLDMDKLASELRAEVAESTGQKHIKAAKRLRVVDSMRRSKVRPEWMILTVLPVIPPDLRPMVQLSGGRFATSDLNDLYRRVINRNNRLKHLIDLGAPEIILRNEKRMLQEAIDALIDATQRTSGRADANELKSLSDMLRGKQGRFRQNLLGKRVDYSGRSVIVVGPNLKLSECGIPKEMALEMFKPFVLRELIARGISPNVRSAKYVLERRAPEVYDILEEITKNHPVLLNRAPTLHKLGIQAFYPILIEGSAISIHPLVCAGYNADFDGDQMAVHVPLSSHSKAEAVNLMMVENNLLKPADGLPITVPNKEMILGVYYYTSLDEKVEIDPTIYSDFAEAIMAYQQGKLALRRKINVRRGSEVIETSVGRILFNEVLIGGTFVNETINLSKMKSLINKAVQNQPREEVARLLDAIKKIGFTGATESGVSVGVFDFVTVAQKEELIAQAEAEVADIEGNYRDGLTTKEEMRRLSVQVWIQATEKITDLTWGAYSKDNPVKVILDAGAGRASRDTVKQLSGMRGLMSDPTGKIVPMPTKSNFRQGLSVFEYVTGTRGSRKGLADTALRTADAGYLTRRLVDVAHDAIIRLVDCGSDVGVAVNKNEKKNVTFASRLLGRILSADVVVDKKTVAKTGDLIDEHVLGAIEESGVESVDVRSPLTCKAKYGLCQKCYGWDYSTRDLVELGTPVGIIAAQSIGEPGTQLTLRTKHSGGIVGEDVTQGLPRVEELFEARTPKVVAPISEIAGKVEVSENEDGVMVRVRSVNIKPAEEREYVIPVTSTLTVNEGDLVGAGTQLASGILDLKDVLAVRGMLGAQRYLIMELQAVYESHGIPIADKHFEVIVRKMSDKLRVETSGDTSFLPGELVERVKFENENARVIAEGGEPATAQVTILGVTRAALCVESWLSAASFEQTTSQLSDAAIRGSEDRLIGLKENVIIGRLIPTSADRARME